MISLLGPRGSPCDPLHDSRDITFSEDEGYDYPKYVLTVLAQEKCRYFPTYININNLHGT